jgi:damage-control phosphatase, subfamily I
MIPDHRCFFCFTRAFEKLIAKENISIEAKNNFTREMIVLYYNNWDKLSAPEFSRELHHILTSYTNNPDPYLKEKKENNDQAARMIPELEMIVRKSSNPFGTSLRLAIAGNIIDFAANDRFNLQATIEMALESEFAIDHSEQLEKEIKRAHSVLYLGDNAGEIVFDKLFIETINHPGLTYVVRGSPIINDATMDDAEYTGMKEAANVISSGYDAASTIPENSSKQFQEYFREADVIISKGQGNLEGLFPLNDKRIFFLLMVKCDVMAEFLKVKKGSQVVYNDACLRIHQNTYNY